MKREDIKTAFEILLSDRKSTTIEMMIKYANQFIDLAAEQAKTKVISEYEVTIDKQSILNIKELIK